INISDDIFLNSGAATVTLQPIDSAQTINLNNSGDDFNLTATELRAFRTAGAGEVVGNLVIGQAEGTGDINVGDSGDIFLTGVLDGFNVELRGGNTTFNNGIVLREGRTLTLNTGAVSSPGFGTDITAAELSLNTFGSVGAEEAPLVTTVDRLNIDGVGGDLFLTDLSDLTVSSTEGSAISGQLDITASGGPLTVGALSVRNEGNDLSLTSDEIDLNGAIAGDGQLTLTPFDSAQSIAIGGNNNSTANLDLTRSELEQIQDGFSRIVIGNEDGSGNLTIQPFKFLDPISIQTSTGQAAINGGLPRGTNVNAAQISTVLDQDITTGTSLRFLGNISLGDDVTINNTGPDNSLIFLGPIDGEQALNINAPDGFVQFARGIGQTVPLTQLIVNSPSTFLGNNVTVNGDIAFNSDITTSSDIQINSQTGAISTGNIQSFDRQIALLAEDGVTTGDISQFSSESDTAAFSGGSAIRDDAAILSFDASSAIAVTARTGAVNTGNISTFGGSPVVIVAQDSITTGSIDTSSSFGPGGDVFLDPQGDIQVGFINAEGGPNSTGGGVDITTQRFFRATDTFSSQNTSGASISTAGGAGSGTITIRHGGGPLGIPFIVGDASQNGTAGTITTGDFSLDPIREFPETFDSNGIGIITATESVLPVDGLEIIEYPEPTSEPGSGPIDSTPDTVITVDPSPEVSRLLSEIEELYTNEFEEYLDLPGETPIKDVEDSREILLELESQTGVRPALIYVSFAPVIDSEENLADSRPADRAPADGGSDGAALNKESGIVDSSNNLIPEIPNDPRQDLLFLTLVTGQGDVVQVGIPGATRDRVLELARQMESDITSPVRRRNPVPLLEPSQQLYQMLVEPLEREFQDREVDNLVFIMDGGLRSLPIAALHNGESFVIEDYSVGLMPSLSLTDTRYVSLRNARVLAMGTSDFSGGGDIRSGGALPAVSVELSTFAKNQRSAEVYRDDDFNYANLQSRRTDQEIVHLATHASFRQGQPENSYIQFRDRVLPLSEFRNLNWQEPQVELAVLSACRTALGDLEAELGFAGAAVQSRVKTVMASLWSVSDIGASGLVAEFYHQLGQAP
ncbi:hypothetical protein C7271_22415, partial [filamentous cyanobacterium CCP5]